MPRGPVLCLDKNILSGQKYFVWAKIILSWQKNGALAYTTEITIAAKEILKQRSSNFQNWGRHSLFSTALLINHNKPILHKKLSILQIVKYCLTFSQFFLSFNQLSTRISFQNLTLFYSAVCNLKSKNAGLSLGRASISKQTLSVNEAGLLLSALRWRIANKDGHAEPLEGFAWPSLNWEDQGSGWTLQISIRACAGQLP